MEILLCIQTYLIAGLIEVIILNFLVGQKNIAPLIGGEVVSNVSSSIAFLIIITGAIMCSITIIWWYFAFVILLFFIVGISNIILYPILKSIGSIIWSIFGPSRVVISDKYDQDQGEVTGCRWLALAYAIIGGGYTLYSLFFD